MEAIFESDNKIINTYFYNEYAKWCANYNLIVKKKKDFYKEVLKTPNYTKNTAHNQEFFVNLKEKSRKEKNREKDKFTF